MELSAKQRKDLEVEQERDLSERYGKLVGKRKLNSALLIARGESGGNVRARTTKSRDS